MDPFHFDFPEQALKGRTILVSGGTGGLGSATVALLAREGADVVAGFFRDSDRARMLQKSLQHQCGVQITLLQADLFREESRQQVWDELSGKLYAYVDFTGDPARTKFDLACDADLHDSLRKNYVAPIMMAREAAARIRESGQSGAIVLVSSMQAVAPFDSSINYAGAKSALIHAARIMARQWGGPEGIRVNVIAPGVNRAGMAMESVASGKYDSFLESGVIPRFGQPEDLARVVRLLLEPDNYITGQVITVDGGLTLRR